MRLLCLNHNLPVVRRTLLPPGRDSATYRLNYSKCVLSSKLLVKYMCTFCYGGAQYGHGSEQCIFHVIVCSMMFLYVFILFSPCELCKNKKIMREDIQSQSYYILHHACNWSCCNNWTWTYHLIKFVTRPIIFISGTMQDIPKHVSGFID